MSAHEFLGVSPGHAHLHLAWYGYEICHKSYCGRPIADPSADMICTDTHCPGGCEAARHNADRRRELT